MKQAAEYLCWDRYDMLAAKKTRTLIWSCSPWYSMDWKMFQVQRRLISRRAWYCRYQRWINRAARMATVGRRERKREICFFVKGKMSVCGWAGVCGDVYTCARAGITCSMQTHSIIATVCERACTVAAGRPNLSFHVCWWKYQYFGSTSLYPKMDLYGSSPSTFTSITSWTFGELGYEQATYLGWLAALNLVG